MILVTGGTGFVGRHLIQVLCDRGHRVRVLTRDASRALEQPVPGPRIQGSRPEFVEGDVLKPASLPTAFAGVSVVVHLAASVPPGARDDRLGEVNVQGTAHLAAAALRAGVERFVHGSSAGVYGDGRGPDPHREDAPLNPGSAYERSKLDAEYAVRRTLETMQVGLVILRIAGVHGPGRPSTLAFFQQVLRRKVWLHVPPLAIVHPTYVGDVVRAIVSAVERSEAAGQTINVAGERALSYPELIELTGRLLGKKVTQVVVPAAPGRAVAVSAATVCRLLHRPVPTAISRRGAPMVNRSLDTSLARRVLGFVPAPLEETLRETISWYRHRGLLDDDPGSGAPRTGRHSYGGLLSGGGLT
jgi:dihydroflavonol-4-reductase